jgi:hypothetical protein
MAHHNPKIRDIRLIGTETEPLLQITFVDGHELTYDTQHLQRFVSDTLDWSLLMNDLAQDRRGA